MVEAKPSNPNITSVTDLNSDPIHPTQINGKPIPAALHGKRILNSYEDFDKTAGAWSNRKKWTLLTVVALCQTSMNFNAAIYSNAVEPLNEYFGISNARMGMVAFLVPYAFGCELWAPLSEELGRWSVMQTSLLGVNASILICALSPTFGGVTAGRVIGGLSSAGGSVTMGMVADMFDADSQQHAVLWASLWSCLGAVIGSISGGPVQQYLSWRWNFWIQLGFSVVTQAVHFFVAKETRATNMLDKAAERARKRGEDEVYGPNEVVTWGKKWHQRLTKEQLKEAIQVMLRPYYMLFTEPIVGLLSLLSGFADALIFSFFESYGYVFKQWDFSPTQISLALFPLAGSYVLAYFSFFPVVARHARQRRSGKTLEPESRLWWLLFQVILLPLGLLGSAFVASGPPLHWSGIIVFSVLIGMANFSIYYATIDYMVASYGEYSASATGGNGFARDFLAGMCALYTGKMYKNLGIRNSQLVLFGLAAVLCVPVWIFYWHGSWLREKSRFAAELNSKKEGKVNEKNTAIQQDRERRILAQSADSRDV
ncbi:MFS general substrate transporter [Bimuria novae-zelandiae CBS 107.79]|uniref:MFS general substrate transporter n=1 Tax=Bimuria novae-zelandiae CBS 107.79 TaxID=1447943 RepID=A0A6A5VZB4_9PLEO|nr:MFS general substrate transporter [Bimuria novae-zelandiae CBS 107.79]